MTQTMRTDTDIDSIEWGSASKGTKRKVYYDITHSEAAIARIHNANVLSKFALGEIQTSDQVRTSLMSTTTGNKTVKVTRATERPTEETLPITPTQSTTKDTTTPEATGTPIPTLTPRTE